MAHQTTIVTRTQRDSSAGSPFPSEFVKLKNASCPIPVHYKLAGNRMETTDKSETTSRRPRRLRPELERPAPAAPGPLLHAGWPVRTSTCCRSSGLQRRLDAIDWSELAAPYQSKLAADGAG